MPHAVIRTDADIIGFSDKDIYFSSKGDFFIKPVSTKCDDFFIRTYQKNGKIVVKLDKTTYPLITDDIKQAIFEFASFIAEETQGSIVHHNLTDTNKDCQIINRYLIKANDLKDFAKSKNKIILELGMGNGEFLTKMAKNNPSTTFIGFEISNEAIAKASKRFNDENLKNVRIVNYDAKYCLDVFKENSVDAVYVNFPEPWYKFKRIKHALLNKNTIKKLKRILAVNGVFKLLTDNLAYAVSSSLACSLTDLENIQKRVIETAKEKIETRYERRWIRKRRQIYSVAFKKTKPTEEKQSFNIDFPVKIEKEFILKDGIIFKVMEIFTNNQDQRIAEITFGESKNPQHAYFGLTKNNELFLLPQSVFVPDREACLAFELARK
ncbi:tRNA (guanosine(46)-N7)-methyltransferase TrmB [Hippea alviniae]|uniref:tRNA (guanosine(46)-N7)-methyltransferase TrmB n=1 Tax=Hippea alviniae TaxID=1279027 RepID=UPI0003B79477|nr:tRNA (guanosine(46)-N7)-methyltransferase TrmB [Hippea alviniae]